LHVFIGVQSVGIFKMSVAYGASASQQGDHFVLSWNQMHGYSLLSRDGAAHAGERALRTEQAPIALSWGFRM
jgi:hypothetical protein